MPSADRDTKSVLELKRTQRAIQININKLFRICDALYEEIHNIKHFIDYKPPSLEQNNRQSDTQNNFQRQQSSNNPMSVLDDVNEFTSSTQQQPQRKLKIIDN